MQIPNSPANLLDGLAKFISAIFHPVFIPFGFFLLASPAQFQYTSIWEPVLALGILVVAPLGASLLYFRKHGIRDIFVIDKKHRPLPFAFNIVGLLGFSFFIPPQAQALGYDIWLLPWLGSFLIANIIGMVITLYWKISLHMMGIGLTAAWLVIYLWGESWFWLPTGGLFLFTLAIAWARRQLNSHNLLQLLVGWAVGIAIVTGIALVISNLEYP